MSKPMRVCENKKQSPQNKHAYPYTRTCNLTFIFMTFLLRRHFFFCWFLLSALSVLGMGLKREEEEKERQFLSTPSSRRREKLNKGWEFREAASWRTQNCKKKKKKKKKEGTEMFFFLSLPALKINARRTRNREITYCALAKDRRAFEDPFCAQHFRALE